MVYTIMFGSKVQVPPICLPDILLCLRMSLNCHYVKVYVKHYTITTSLVFMMLHSIERGIEFRTLVSFCVIKNVGILD